MKQRGTYDVPDFAPGDVLLVGGLGFRVVRELRRLEERGRSGDAAFLAETADPTAVRVVLRIFAEQPESSPGAHVATAWRDEDDPRSADGLVSHGESYWLPCAPTHGVFLTPRQRGLIRAIGAYAESPHPSPSAYRAAPFRVEAPLEALARPLPFVAFDCVEGATARTLLRAAARRSLPLGPGFALAVGASVAAALAWLEANPVEAPGAPRPVWHGRLDARYVFVTAAGRCRLLTPVRRIEHDFAPELFTVADLQRVQEEDAHDRLGHLPWARGAAGDLWRLGVLLWECAVGRGPFADADGRASPEALGTREPPPASSFEPQVTPALDACLAGLLAHDPARRFASAAKAHAALAEALASFEGPCDEAALAAVVAVLGAGEDGALALAGDGRDGTGEAVVLRVTV